jgi:hypothetical protein
MSEIIFCRTRYFYQSYTDFWSLVELSEFPTCFIDEVDLRTDAIFIIPTINGEVRPHLDNHREDEKRAKIIWWNLERCVEVLWSDLQDVRRPVFACSKQSFDTLPNYVDKVWISDRLFADSMQNPRIQFVPMGSHPGLSISNRTGNFDFDFASMSYINDRRAGVHNQLAHLRAAPNAWPPERDEILNRSKLFLNVHQSDHLIGEPLRFAVAAASKCPLVSETLTDPFPMVPDVDFLFGDYQQLGLLMHSFCSGYRDFSSYADSLYNRLCVEFEFGKNVRGGAEEL